MQVDPLKLANRIIIQSNRWKKLFFSDFLIFGKYSLLAAATVHVLFLVLFFYLGIFPMVIFNTFSVLIYAYCLITIKSSLERNNTVLISWLVYIEIMSHAAFASYYVGTHSGFHYYIILLGALTFLTYGDSKATRTGKLILVIIAFTILDIALIDYVPPYILDQTHTSNIRGFNSTAFITSAVFVSLFYSKINNDVRSKLEHASTTDELTGLYNRRLFIHLAENELKEIRRDNSTLSIIILDIDDFKSINDKYGHTCGDQALINVSAILHETVRPRDIVSRWGGEEFIILLPETDIEHATVVAERLRTNIEKKNMVCKAVEFTMTVTQGLASNETRNKSLHELIEQADNAMYIGKTSGKNRCVIAN